MKLTGKMVAIRSGHFRDPPWDQMAKNLFLSVFLRELPGKIMAIGSAHFEDPPWDKMTKNLVFVSFSQETSWQNSGHRKWPHWGPSLRPNGQKFSFRQFFSWNLLAKWWPLWKPSLRSNGQKNCFCQFFSGNFLAKWWPMEMATLATPMEMATPCGQMAKKLFLSVFLRKLPGKMAAIGSGHFGDPPWGQMTKEIFFYPEFPRKNIIHRKLRARK